MINPLAQVVWHSASARGPRSVNADAASGFGEPPVFAVADGIGDSPAAARAARIAVSAAVLTSAGPVDSLLAAQGAVSGDPSSGDCVLVVAVPYAGGYHIGWVGDVRAYAWDGASLRQLTHDHTLAQYFRDRGQDASPQMEHMVTTSVRTAGATRFGLTALRRPAGLLLTTDGVHKRLPPATMAELLRRPSNSARSLVDAALAAGGTDNATALLVECEPRLSEPATEAFAVAA
ncbi:serine/threonine protein phosphatase [Amycolatopsis sp. K13G38]|uniref:Serine/threonine protein phosphatase n=1 Tax=Amycolatopsis acididurans TaxID=2724524 RepID=A0ABX1JAU2_9PSEU|nr:protein phosphatase 2C domain-containing protein [Amycolatopsis acididurans]NKQ56912.1 serine/threonine protein phosphatase [Amycolatopsis acididurans]